MGYGYNVIRLNIGFIGLIILKDISPIYRKVIFVLHHPQTGIITLSEMSLSLSLTSDNF